MTAERARVQPRGLSRHSPKATCANHISCLVAANTQPRVGMSAVEQMGASAQVGEPRTDQWFMSSDEYTCSSNSIVFRRVNVGAIFAVLCSGLTAVGEVLCGDSCASLRRAEATDIQGPTKRASPCSGSVNLSARDPLERITDSRHLFVCIVQSNEKQTHLLYRTQRDHPASHGLQHRPGATASRLGGGLGATANEPAAASFDPLADQHRGAQIRTGRPGRAAWRWCWARQTRARRATSSSRSSWGEGLRAQGRGASQLR